MQGSIGDPFRNQPNEEQMETEAAELFGDNPIDAYNLGLARYLTTNRTSHLGQLLLADRAVFYMQILYRMRLFRNTHELEPLHDDLFEAAFQAQQVCSGETYDGDQFRADLNQLVEWKLVSGRIEKQRIRGYRDNRKKKYRYQLTSETLAFLSWLEDRLQDDLEGSGADARNQLEDVSGALRELLRLLHHFKPEDENEEDARRILYQLFKLEEITTAINTNLAEFNARLLSFVTRSYDLEEIKLILGELESYIARFLRQIHGLRREIIGQLDRLPKFAVRLEAAFTIMENERRKTPHLMRRNALHPDRVATRMLDFYRESGYLDRTCRRIDTSSLEALRKMYAHLREMERKNHRMEDLGNRLKELSQLEEDQPPHAFIARLISSAHGCFDLHYWNESEKADPPQPRTASSQKKQPPKSYLKPRSEGQEPVITIEQARLERLKNWLTESIVKVGPSARVSQGNFSEFDDFTRLIELARAGYLTKGRKLAKIGYELREEGSPVETRINDKVLRYKDMEVRGK